LVTPKALNEEHMAKPADRRRPTRRVASAALVAAAVIAVAACGGEISPTPSQSPSPSPAASAGASPSPPASAPAVSISPGPAAIAVDSIALVVTDDLRVRSLPGVSDESKLLTPLLDSGREVFVIAGPVAASGFDWYQVKPLSGLDEFELPLGWVAAAGKDGEQWLAGDRFACPPIPEDYRAFLALRALVAVACLGDREITFAARIGGLEEICGIDVGWEIVPEWFDTPCSPPFYLYEPGATDDDLSWSPVLHPNLDITGLRPGIEPEEWIDVEVTGHHDDAAARTCQAIAYDPEVTVPISPEQAVLGCRSQFVLTSVRRAGSP
jgi:hypothetical protein